MRASLEAEASALRGQLDDALAEGVELRAKISEAVHFLLPLCALLQPGGAGGGLTAPAEPESV